MLSEKPWRAEAVMLFCAAQFVCLAAGLILVGLLQKTGLAAFKPPDGFGAVLLATLSFQGAAWLLIWIFLRQHQMDWRDAFGLRRKNLPRALLAALVVASVILPVALLIEYGSVALLDKIGWPRLALFGVSLLFAAIHLDAAIFVPLFVLALALTGLYEFTDNLLAPIVAHSLFNTANLVILLSQK